MDTLLQLMESYGYIAMFVAMALENANHPPSHVEVVLGFAGFLISQQIFSFWTTFAVACVAGLVGSVISYWLGSYGGRPLLLKYGKYIFFNERKFRMAEDLFNKYGGIAVIICRCLPGVRTFISFPAGVARYPFWKFAIFTVIGTIPWTLLLVWAGSLLGSHWRDLIQYNHIFLMAVIAVCVVATVVFVWHRRRRRNAE
ncbi:Dolichyl-phosphate-mannose-protein mannosyltransferase [Megasphaera sp. BL7]|uniref:DedA family protein n=1 Tax=Megasphaera sp. BL7 TaxID=1285585 RepID=UPI0003579DC0|nr:DedA family protein [Megasphaera sp. BL7]EPP17264.1 Dolichyl-phosphate-mannose-protein mannosyltransferase [Megasphaera sp. BL7]